MRLKWLAREEKWMINIGDKVLVTTDGWFFAPDGETYRAVFGTVNGGIND